MALCWPPTVGASTTHSAEFPVSDVPAGAVKLSEVVVPVVRLVK